MGGGVGFGWLVFFSLLLAPFPFLKSAGTRVLYNTFFNDTFRVFEILSRSLAMGHRKEIFELDLCGSIFFFLNLFQLHRSCAGDSLFIIVASRTQN